MSLIDTANFIFTLIGLVGLSMLFGLLYASHRLHKFGTGPRTPDCSMVICPTCTSQFRAIPVEVQAQLRTLEKDLDTAFAAS